MKVLSVALIAALGIDIAIRQGGALAATIGCYPRYSSGTTYTPGAMVSYTRSVTTTESCTANTAGCPSSGTREVTANVRENYECVSDVWCSNSGYAPGTVYEGETWTRKEKCDPSEPTPDPIVPDEWDLSGCPPDYVAGVDYEEGDAVSVQLTGSYKMVYTCAAHPNSLFCGKANFDPGTSLYWKEAWIEQGSCSGSLAPTVSPAFEDLQDQGGCPEEYSSGSKYDEMDKVSIDGFVYQCKTYPESGFCMQAGYEPGNTDNDNWKMAWDLLGYCEGSISPTTSPAFNPDLSIGGCPDEWISGGGPGGYSEGGMVSVMISMDPERKVAYRCRAWPYDGHCGQFSPTEFGGDQGWQYAGSCDGSLGPTQSPVFESLNEIGDGCPAEHDSSVDYKAGDQVAVVISDATDDALPERTLVYECKSDVHLSKYCANQVSIYSPGKAFGYLGWNLKGFCSGTVSPTLSPTQYQGICTYTKCTESDCSPGSSGCSCGSNAPSGSHCTKKTCTETRVERYSRSTTYEAGDVVHVAGQRFKCKSHPFTGWCSIDTYEPELEINEFWPSAWVRDGQCPRAGCSDRVVNIESATQDLDDDGGEITFSFPNLEEATSDVIIKVTAIGDLSHSSEFYAILPEGSAPLGFVGLQPEVDDDDVYEDYDHSDCDYPYVGTFVIPMADFNSYIADGTLTIRADAPPAVGHWCADDDWIQEFNRDDVTIALSYRSCPV